MKKILLVICLLFFNSLVSYSEEFTYSDGSKYIGQTKNKERHGQGTFVFSDGSKYVGEFKNNLKHGQGTYTGVKKQKYIGEYKNGYIHGKGKMINYFEKWTKQGKFVKGGFIK